VKYVRAEPYLTPFPFFFTSLLFISLQPDNIGFSNSKNNSATDCVSDCDEYTNLGTLKVFDFDVARILPNDEQSSATSTSTALPLYQMTKRVGSPRYMSPECARGDMYNEKADV
jgi:serine/threonine protein kinase